jgi:hemerythrin-like domain-containing protein
MELLMNLFNTPAPDFQHPLQLLSACHGRITGFNALLLRLPSHIAANGIDADVQQAATRILKYFDTAGQHHHEDEERSLFPVLRDIAAQEGNQEILELLELLIAQHQEMNRTWQELRLYLLTLSEGGEVDPAALPVERFVGLYQEHMPLEDKVLLPYASRVLNAAQLDSLGDAMAERRGV